MTAPFVYGAGAREPGPYDTREDIEALVARTTTPELGRAVIADAAMYDDETAGWLADKYGDRTVSEALLERANRALELIETGQSDLDKALGAIYYIQTRPLSE